MADCHIYYDELRFNVREEGLTHVYVLVRAEGDCPHTVGGWYHRAYPSSRTTEDILKTMWDEDRGVLFWGRKAP